MRSLRLGHRTVGGDGRGVRAAVPDPGTGRGEGLRVDELAALPEHVDDVTLKGDVRLDVGRVPLVDRRERVVRLRAAPVVLEEQVLGHGLPPGVVGRARWWPFTR